MTDCMKCKHFVYCDFTKQIFYKACTSESCDEFTERAEIMTLGQKIKKARERLDMPKTKLAELTGISYGALVNYEGDRTEPPLSYAVKIADVLGVRLDYLARDKI